jgi:hypothetical protein
MADAHIIALKVRPKRSSDAAFNAGGIVAKLNPATAFVGTTVTAFDLAGQLHARLGDQEMNGGQPTGRLLYGAAKIRSVLEPASLCVLANEDVAAQLDQANLRRQNLFLTRYKHAQTIANMIVASYQDKLPRLTRLRKCIEDHFATLDQAYAGAPSSAGGDPEYNFLEHLPSGIVRPRTVMASHVSHLGTALDQKTQIYETDIGGTLKQTHTNKSTSTLAKHDGTGWKELSDFSALTVAQQTVAINENDELRHPKLENEIRHKRVSSDLIDEILAETIFSLRLSDLTGIFANELADLDLGLRQLQVLFAETFLVPRIDGKVTSLAVDAGDAVRPGQAIATIESDNVLLLYGQLRFPGLISVGQAARVETTNVFGAKPAVPLSLPGTVVVARGYDGDTHKWNVAIECANTGMPRLPLGYDFETRPGYSKVVLT